MVIHPFGGTPAYKAGIRPGDMLIEVNDKRVDTLTTTEVADMLSGPKGTKVQVIVNARGRAEADHLQLDPGRDSTQQRG